MARHADIVLPSTVNLERDDIGWTSSDGYLIAMPRAVEPFAASRDDHEILADLAKDLGVWDDFTEGRTALEWVEHLYEQTRERLGAGGVVVPPFDEFWATGEAQLPATFDGHTALETFRSDPDVHPLATPSGRIELFSETIDGFGYDDCPGHPTWLEPIEWLGGPRADRYPLHLIA